MCHVLGNPTANQKGYKKATLGRGGDFTMKMSMFIPYTLFSASKISDWRESLSSSSRRYYFSECPPTPDLPVWYSCWPSHVVSTVLWSAPGSPISLPTQSGRNITIKHVCFGVDQVLEKQTLPNAKFSSASGLSRGGWGLPSLNSWVRHWVME